MRRTGILVSSIIFVLSLISASARAATLTVNSLGDDATPANGFVTLREAIPAANTDTATDLGQTGSGPDTVDLRGLSGMITLDAVLPDLAGDTTEIGRAHA